ncbi:MAG TPA: hypothetical protein VFE14_11045 [Micromonosporaceae bacterium]|nr:hypothetical protein [Micromonosporaceae bacterium]
MTQDDEILGFELVWKGYDIGQVDRYIDDLNQRLDAAMAGLDALGTLETQLYEAQAEIGRLRAAARHGSAARQVGARISEILTLAEEQAAELRAQARRDAEQIRRRAATAPVGKTAPAGTTAPAGKTAPARKDSSAGRRRARTPHAPHAEHGDDQPDNADDRTDDGPQGLAGHGAATEDIQALQGPDHAEGSGKQADDEVQPRAHTRTLARRTRPAQ